MVDIHKLREMLLNRKYQGREKLILGILLIIATPDGVAECDRDWLCKATSYSARRLDARLEYMIRAGYIEPLKATETQYRYRLPLA